MGIDVFSVCHFGQCHADHPGETNRDKTPMRFRSGKGLIIGPSGRL
jgi:hypothetical protein